MGIHRHIPVDTCFYLSKLFPLCSFVFGDIDLFITAIKTVHILVHKTVHTALFLVKYFVLYQWFD